MIVVDTNVVAYVLIEGDQTEAAAQVLRKDPQWAAPLLWRSEFRDVLTMYIRQGDLGLEHARGLMDLAERLLHGGEHHVVSNRVLELAEASGCSAYDCEFVALAEDLDAPMVTADRKLQAAFPVRVLSLGAFLAS